MESDDALYILITHDSVTDIYCYGFTARDLKSGGWGGGGGGYGCRKCPNTARFFLFSLVCVVVFGGMCLPDSCGESIGHRPCQIRYSSSIISVLAAVDTRFCAHSGYYLYPVA